MPIPRHDDTRVVGNTARPDVGVRHPTNGYKANNGQYLEHQQLEPDTRVENDPNKLLQGIDQQLEQAVRELLKEINQ